MHGAPGEHRASGRRSTAATFPARGGSRCRRCGPSGSGAADGCSPLAPGVQEQVDVGGDVVAQEDDLRHDDRGEDQDRQQPGADAPSGRPGPARSALCRRRARRGGRPAGPRDAARGSPGPADRAHQRGELGTDRRAVDRGGRLLQPPGDDGDAGDGQVPHRPVELGQALVGGRTSGGTGQPGGRCDVREDRARRTPGDRAAAPRPAVRGRDRGRPGHQPRRPGRRDVVAVRAAGARRRFRRRGREHTRADLEACAAVSRARARSRLSSTPPEADEGGSGRSALASVGEWREVRVLTLGHPSSRQVRHRQPPPPNRC